MLSIFIKDRCILKPASRTRAKTLYEAYLRFAESECLPPATHKAFRLALASRGWHIEPDQTQGDVWHGIGLKEPRA